jgi:hypothetical protein
MFELGFDFVEILAKMCRLRTLRHSAEVSDPDPIQVVNHKKNHPKKRGNREVLPVNDVKNLFFLTIILRPAKKRPFKSFLYTKKN